MFAIQETVTQENVPVVTGTKTKIYNFSDIKSKIEQQQFAPSKKNIVGLDNLPEKEVYDHAVSALRRDDILRIQKYFLTKPERYVGTNIRDYAFFMVGVNIAERISDLLKLQVKDVINNDGSIVDSLTIIQQKTQEVSFITLSPAAKEVLDVYLSHRWDSADEELPWGINDYLFYNYRTKKAITRKAAWEIMNKAQAALGLDYSIGTHTLRKTWGKAVLEQSSDPETLYRVMERYGHSRLEHTKRYLKMDRQERAAFMSRASIGDPGLLREAYC